MESFVLFLQFSPKKALYFANGIIEYEIPMKGDLNATSTVKALMNYCQELRTLIQKEVEKEENAGIE